MTNLNVYHEAVEKLKSTLDILKNAQRYDKDMYAVMKSLDEGLSFTKEHYGELNSNLLFAKHVTRGSDIYFFFMRFSHQFFNVMTLVSIMPHASYYQRAEHILNIRQNRFEELCNEAIAKATALYEEYKSL